MRKTGLFTAMILLATVVFAQEKGAPDKRIETILGTWKVQKIVSGKTEVAKNPTSGQWIEFRSDGKYVNHSTEADSGSFRINENHSILYMESQARRGSNGEAKVVEWTISLTDNALTMQEKRSPSDKGSASDKKGAKDAMKYVYVRIEQGSKKLNN